MNREVQIDPGRGESPNIPYKAGQSELAITGVILVALFLARRKK